MGGMDRTLAGLAAGLLTLVSAVAGAQRACPTDAVGCETQDVDFEHFDALFDSVMIDTGWVPSGSPIQVRFGLVVAGQTQVRLGGTATTAWPGALDVAVPGRPETGLLAVDYGFELIARLRFDVDIAGIGYTWEGDIPTGDIPTDLRVAADLVFDPFVLPDSSPRPVSVYDETDEVTVYDLPITGGLVSIPGFGGGFIVTARAGLEGSYQTEHIAISDAPEPIRIEDAFTRVMPDSGAIGFGAAKDYTVLPHGTIGYDGEVILRPAVYLEIAGSRVDLAAFDLPIPLVDTDVETRFEAADVHAPLPDIHSATALVFEATPVGSTRERLLEIENRGESELVVSLVDPEAPFAIDRAMARVPPRSTGRVAVTLTPTDVSSVSGTLLLVTNDPDRPEVSVELRGVGEASGDAGVLADAGADAGGGGPAMNAGCACRAHGGASGRSAGGWFGLGVVGLLWVRRRRGAFR